MSGIKHFKADEFACRCGCGLNNMNYEVVKSLDDARDLAGVPFILNRGCSCIAHNKEVLGSESSSHLDGLAVDIKVKNSRDRFLIVYSLIQSGFNRIGVYKNFVHADKDYSKVKNVIWYT